MAWTSPRTWTAGEVVTAAILNVHLRDNLFSLFGSSEVPTVGGGSGFLNVKLRGRVGTLYMDYTTFGPTGIVAGFTIANVSGDYRPAEIHYLQAWNQTTGASVLLSVESTGAVKSVNAIIQGQRIIGTMAYPIS